MPSWSSPVDFTLFICTQSSQNKVVNVTVTPMTPHSLPYRRHILLSGRKAQLYIAHHHSLKYVVFLLDFLLDASVPSIFYVFLTKLIGAQVVLVAAEPVCVSPPPPPPFASLFCSFNILETFIVAYYTDARVLPSCIRITQLILSTLHNYSSICKFLVSHRVFWDQSFSLKVLFQKPQKEQQDVTDFTFHAGD